MLKFVFLSLDTFPRDAINSSPTGSTSLAVLALLLDVVVSGKLGEQGASP